MNARQIAIFVLIQYVKTKNSRFTAKSVVLFKNF
jgi:hypothetical protein